MNVIGLCGVATCGKDFFFANLKSATKRKVFRFAIADALKEEMYDFIKNTYNIDVFNCSPEEKTTIRPILVNHAEIRRKETNGRYWINKLTEKVKKVSEDKKNLAVITDIRFDEYEKDEVFWLKNELNGFLVHISKYFLNDKNEMQFVPPANLQESKNNPKLIDNADYIVEWQNGLTPEKAREYCSDALVTMRLTQLKNSLTSEK